MRAGNLRADELREREPDIILIDENCLHTQVLQELSSLHDALPSTRTLVIGDAPSSSKLLEGLRVGVWGVLARSRAASEIEPALHAVSRDELWLSRGRLCGLLMMALSSLEPTPTEAQIRDLPQLTLRENAVMQRVIQGYSNKEIARTLGITDHTVKVHLHHIYGKLHLRRVDLLLGHRTGANPAGMATG
jgi:two-component system nitrate/nitrite response regulator NarL